MIRTTKPQRRALKDLFDRRTSSGADGLTYRQFRKTVRPLMGGGGVIMVRWADMWIGVESDGYAHS